MSLESWMEEFYPVEASSSATSDEDALAHSLKKWEGLTEENLKKHGVQRRAVCLEDDAGHLFGIDSETCALCQRRNCTTCPLYIVRKKIQCYIATDEEDYSPYGVFISDGDPQPMINLIRQAIEEAKK
jgi:hypothetical protein